MAYYDEQFISEFNSYYPLERYIVKNPKSIDPIFDDLLLVEMFVPSTEIKPVFTDDNQFLGHTKVNDDDVYVKLQTPSGDVIRIGFWDFESHIRENIRDIIYFDFGGYEWEALYVEHEDDDDEGLKKVLLEQQKLILEKYGTCNVKDTASSNLIIE